MKCNLLLDVGWGVGIVCKIFAVTSLSKLSAPFLAKRSSIAFCKRSRSWGIVSPVASMWGGGFFKGLLLIGQVAQTQQSTKGSGNVGGGGSVNVGGGGSGNVDGGGGSGGGNNGSRNMMVAGLGSVVSCWLMLLIPKSRWRTKVQRPRSHAT